MCQNSIFYYSTCICIYLNKYSDRLYIHFHFLRCMKLIKVVGIKYLYIKSNSTLQRISKIMEIPVSAAVQYLQTLSMISTARCLQCVQSVTSVSAARCLQCERHVIPVSAAVPAGLEHNIRSYRCLQCVLRVIPVSTAICIQCVPRFILVSAAVPAYRPFARSRSLQCVGCVIPVSASEPADHRRRIELVDKAKVVKSVWGTESLPRQLFFPANG